MVATQRRDRGSIIHPNAARKGADMADFKLQAAQQRLKVLAAAKQQVLANVSRYESENDLDSASDELQAFSNLEAEEQNLISAYQRYQQQSAPRQPEPISDSEFLAMSPEKMLQHPELVDRIFQKSKMWTKGMWGEPEVADGVRRGLAEIERRKKYEGGR
jgi:hypothetical protein